MVCLKILVYYKNYIITILYFFAEVRTSSVESICKLCPQNQQFANSSLDFLIDMFNDEIEEVRLKAIDCLRYVAKHIMLRDDQLETILG